MQAMSTNSGVVGYMCGPAPEDLLRSGVTNEALVSYERVLLDHGFDIVRTAAEIGEQRMGRNPLPA